MLTIRRFQKGDEEILSVMIRRTLREVNYTSPKSERIQGVKRPNTDVQMLIMLIIKTERLQTSVCSRSVFADKEVIFPRR